LIKYSNKNTMLTKSKVNKVNQSRRPFEKSVWNNTNGKPKEHITVVQPMLCQVGDELGIISKNNQTYILINKRNEVFFLKHDEVECVDDIQTEMNFKNRVPQFVDFLEEEVFDLDLL